MKKNKAKKISLGFTEQKFEAGAHICQIYSEEEERSGALVNYIVSGLEGSENTICFSEKESAQTMADFFNEKGISYRDVYGSGAFSLDKTRNVYFEGGRFEPERMINLLKDFYTNSINSQRTGARVIGEMLPEISSIPGGSRLLEYESKISLLLRDYPVTAVCQYDTREFEGAVLMDVLKVHPYMIVRGSVVNNPFFIEPEAYLLSRGIK
jgi:hypothetical protein